MLKYLRARVTVNEIIVTKMSASDIYPLYLKATYGLMNYDGYFFNIFNKC